MYDLIVVGGGMGGLATAGLALKAGMRVALLEAHANLGGCAGYFEREPYTFDAGATALMGLAPDEPIGRLLATLDVPFRGRVTPSYRVHIGDRTVDIVADAARFEANCRAAFPAAPPDGQRHFWRLQAAVGERLFAAASRGPRLPFRSVDDVAHTLRALGVGGTMAAITSLVTVADVLRFFGLDRDPHFVAFLAMLLQDTAQAGPEVVPFANASACLQAYRRGMARPVGGMKALAEGIGAGIAAIGGEIRRGTIVDRVEAADGKFTVVTRRRQRLKTRQVAFNLPIDLAAKLLGRDLSGSLARDERKSRAVWSAFTAYLAMPREVVPDDGPLFHQVLLDPARPIHDGNNALISLSPPGDPGYGPAEVRLATMSTHTAPEAWHGLSSAAYADKKADYAARMLAALRRALPGAPDRLVHAEFATVRSFIRYTRRTDGAVGGPPVSQRNANLRAVGADALGPGVWLVGDSVFPGQGTMAVVLSARNAVERMVGP